MPLFGKYLRNETVANSNGKTTVRGFLRNGIRNDPLAIQTVVDAKFRAPTRDEHQQVLRVCEEELEFLKRKIACVYCNQFYISQDNLGCMRCSWHPKNCSHLLRYPCCDRPTGSPGCKPCDHSPVYQGLAPRWTQENDTEVIPLAVAVKLAIPASVCVETKHDRVRIKRCVY